MPAAHRNLGNDDAETAFEAGGHQGIDTPIRLTINEIIKVAGLALMPPLIENPAALKVFREEISQFPIGRLAKFSFLDVAAHDDVVPEGLFVALFQAKDSFSLYLLEKQGIARLDVLSYISHGLVELPPPNEDDDSEEDEENLLDVVPDPAKVTRSALQNAASIASMLLTTETLISDLPEKEKMAAPPMPEY